LVPKIIENLRDDILNEAINIIDDGGMDALSLRSISNRLGIAASTIYNYYGSKEEIIGALLRLRWETALCEIVRKTADISDTCEALEAVVSELCQSVKPLLRLHISSAKGMENAHGHSAEYQRQVLEELNSSVARILNRGGGESFSDEEAAVITKLLITCTHDTELKISDIIRTVSKI